MLTRLAQFLSGVRGSRRHPSVVLVIGELSRSASVLHIVPEDGTSERLGIFRQQSDVFTYGGSTEQFREQLATITLHVGDGEHPMTLLHDISSKAKELLNTREKQDFEAPTTSVEQALRSATAGLVEQQRGKAPSTNATQTYPVLLVHIDRPKPGKLVTEAEFTTSSH